MKVDEGCQRTTNEPPHKVLFGKAPPTGLFPGATSIMEEEDMDEHHRPIPPPTIKPIPARRRQSTCHNDTHLQEAETEPETIHLPQTKPDSESEPDDQSRHTKLKRIPAPRRWPTCHNDPHLREAETEPDSESEPDDQSRHTVVRKRAFWKTMQAAERMEHFYNKKKRIKIATFSVGDVVSVGVPKLDRATTDMKRILAMITQVHGIKRLSYTLATKYGRLKTNCLAGDLEKFSGPVTPDLTQ